MRGVTVNVGCGGPRSPGREEAMTDWAGRALQREPAFVFAQEVPASGWVDVWTVAGYQPITGVGREYRCRSLVLARADMTVRQLGVDDCPMLSYHGSYVAAASWAAPGRPEPVVVASVHASPNPAEPETYGWSWPLPKARHGGPRSPWPNDRLWDADLLLVTVGHLAGRGLIAAGDYNETLTDDADGVTWAAEFHDIIRRMGLADALVDAWGHERATRFPPDGDARPGQLDHVLVDRVGAQLVASDPTPEVDDQWQAAARDGTGVLSDHAPVWFHLSL